MTKLRIAPGSATLTLYGLRLISSANTLPVAAIVPATDEAAAINFLITTHPLSRFLKRKRWVCNGSRVESKDIFDKG